jgi:carboxypeptidase Q
MLKKISVTRTVPSGRVDLLGQAARCNAQAGFSRAGPRVKSARRGCAPVPECAAGAGIQEALVIALSLAAALAATPTRPAPAAFSSEAAEHIVGGALASGLAYARLAELTDTVGPRLSGTEGAAAAVQWALKRFGEDGLKAHLEKVLANHWERGEERAEVLASPSAAGLKLAVTALGGSIGTPEGGLTAEIVEVSSFDELRALGGSVRGKIVLFQHTMSTPAGYGEFAVFRHRGASEAARLGAVAAFVRSLATASLRSPHTGAMAYAADAPKIPAAAVATEDAELVHRLLSRGPVRVHLVLGCRQLAPVESANVVAEVRGREHPEEVVLLGAHLDSWDLGQGAIDDGAGVAIVMEAGRLLAQLKTPPRRTVRVVLFMNEENGLDGAKAYAKEHEAEVSRHVAALEADNGGGRPLGLGLRAGQGASALFSPWLGPLAALGSSELTEGGEGGADLSPLARALVPIVSVRQDNAHYFDLHHSAADTLDKVNPFELAQVAAEVGWVAYALAEMPRALPRPAASATASTPAGAAGPAAPLSPASSTTSSAAAAGARK